MSKNEMKVTQQHELDREMSDICKSAFAKYIHLPFKRGETVNMFMYAINKSFHLDFSRTQIYLHFNTNIFSFSTQIYLHSNTNIFVLTKIHLPFERTQRVNMFMNAINKLETILFGLYRNTLATKHMQTLAIFLKYDQQSTVFVQTSQVYFSPPDLQIA